MTHPPLDEPWQEPRAVKYGRANQGAKHYRPRPRNGRVTPSRSQAVAQPPRKSTNHRRFWLFAIALLVALAAGAAMFTAVLAGPAPTAQAPDAPAPTRTTKPADPPPTGRDTEPAEHEKAGREAPPSAASGAPDRNTPPHTATKTTPAAASGDGGGSATGGGGTPTPSTAAAVTYKNCGQARKAGAAPLHRGDPGYSAALDRDGDGVACNPGRD